MYNAMINMETHESIGHFMNAIYNKHIRMPIWVVMYFNRIYLRKLIRPYDVNIKKFLGKNINIDDYINKKSIVI